MRRISAVLLCLLAAALFLGAQPPPANCPCLACQDPVRPDLDPVVALQTGNARFTRTRGKPQHPRQSARCVRTLQCCQKPFAIVLSCADSRVPPEVIFDQGIGDLFVVRVAGNVAGKTTPAVLGSIEYAVDVLKTNVIIVLGHQRCGAVKAAFGNRPVKPHLDAIWDLIRPAIPMPPPDPLTEEAWDWAVRQNVHNMAENLGKDLQVENKPTIKEAYFSLETGAVTIKQ